MLLVSMVRQEKQKGARLPYAGGVERAYSRRNAHKGHRGARPHRELRRICRFCGSGRSRRGCGDVRYRTSAHGMASEAKILYGLS